MGAILTFAILFLAAYVAFSIIDHQLEAYIKSEDKKKASRSSGWPNYEKVEVNVKTDKQIKEEVRQKTLWPKRWVYIGLAALILVITLFSCFFTTNEQQVAFTMTFGKVSIVEGAGIHFRIPYVTRVYKFDSTAKGMAIGYNSENNESITEESLMITSDFNFVNTDFYIEYRISDPIKYKFGSNNPEGILRNIAQASIRNTVGLYGVDAVITTGKAEIQAIVRDQIIEKLQTHNTGLSIVNVLIQDVEPPTEEVSSAFKAVETAKQNAETAVNDAKKAEKEKIPNAEAEKDKILKAAEASKTERINQATQEVAEFSALYAEYLRNPETVKMQLYYDLMEDILPKMEIIIGNDSKVIYVQNGETSADSKN